MTQEKALEILKSGRNVFLTGSAGTGKTYVLNKFIEHLRDCKVKVAVTASTGIAATHISGKTIHSWAGIGIKQELTQRDLSGLQRKEYLKKSIEKAKVLIIDEISMLHRKQLEAVDQVLCMFKGNKNPFGGMQVVLCGDFFQLPPIGTENEMSRDKFCFMSTLWGEADFHPCYLTEQYRQNQDPLADILDALRNNTIGQHELKMLQAASYTQFDEKITPTRLYTHNLDVDALNEAELDKLPGRKRNFRATSSGEQALIETLKRSVLAYDKLPLKEGAKVMFVKNSPEKGYINGSLGEVFDFESTGFPKVKLLDGTVITATPEKWTIDDEQGNELAWYNQIPLRLAWAITVHKSQGMTLDAAEVDLSATFEKGQGYVALSRLRKLDSLKLLGFNQRALQIDGLAQKADKRFQELSLQNELISSDILDKDRKAFIKASGGRSLKKL